MGRVAYLLWSCTLTVLAALVALLALTTITLGGGSAMFGWTLLGLAVLLFVQGFVMALGRRLHDLGLSAVHVLWLLPVLVLGAAYAQFGPGGEVRRLLAGLFALAVHLWLVAAPGQRGANAWGPGRREWRRRSGGS